MTAQEDPGSRLRGGAWIVWDPEPDVVFEDYDIALTIGPAHRGRVGRAAARRARSGGTVAGAPLSTG